ncbi:unnamed protein product [Linum trigynum]
MEETKQSIRVIDEHQIENPIAAEEEPVVEEADETTTVTAPMKAAQILRPRIMERPVRKKSERTNTGIDSIGEILGLELSF